MKNRMNTLLNSIIIMKTLNTILISLVYFMYPYRITLVSVCVNVQNLTNKPIEMYTLSLYTHTHMYIIQLLI